MELPFKIIVTSLQEAQALQWKATHIVSILNSDGVEVSFANAVPHHVEIFDDLESERDEANRPGARNSPKMKNIISILEFTSQLSHGDVLLIHCHAGLCRSTAMAQLIMIQHGMSVSESLTHLLEIRRHAWPNKAVIRLGDVRLGLSGTLVSMMDEWRDDIIESMRDGNIIF